MTKEEFVRNESWILKVIRDRCELTQAEADYLNFLIEVLEQKPTNTTNGEVIKALFPYIEPYYVGDNDIVDVYGLGTHCVTFDSDFWDAAYGKENK